MDKYCVFGNPIAHSKSPEIHAAYAAQTGQQLTYEKRLAPVDGFADAVAAFKIAVDRDVPGIFNISGDGVLPLSTVIRAAGRTPLPVPRSLANTVVGALWFAQVAEAPPAFFDYLQYVCVADGERAKKTLGFRPLYTSREALIDYAGAQHLRDVKLLSETPA